MFNYLILQPLIDRLNDCLVHKRLFLISIEYKFFIYNSYLYILLGNSNYLLVRCPSELFIICKKKKMYLWVNATFSMKNLFNFLTIILNLKKINIYKGKGLIASKNFKLIRLKKGKKQQFM